MTCLMEEDGQPCSQIEYLLLTEFEKANSVGPVQKVSPQFMSAWGKPPEFIEM